MSTWYRVNKETLEITPVEAERISHISLHLLGQTWGDGKPKLVRRDSHLTLYCSTKEGATEYVLSRLTAQRDQLRRQLNGIEARIDQLWIDKLPCKIA